MLIYKYCSFIKALLLPTQQHRDLHSRSEQILLLLCAEWMTPSIREAKSDVKSDTRMCHWELLKLSTLLTCKGKLSMRDVMPKVTNRRLVKMKALMALVSFWIFLFVFEAFSWLGRTKFKRQKRLMATQKVRMWWNKDAEVHCDVSDSTRLLLFYIAIQEVQLRANIKPILCTKHRPLCLSVCSIYILSWTLFIPIVCLGVWTFLFTVLHPPVHDVANQRTGQ